ncbi:MAG: hypothetical protein P4K80_07705 [Acidobacteriaceae bacterium]|nr:hypothetical protein [Acidobacteriaceae bacterium]
MATSRNAWLRALALILFVGVFAAVFFRLPYYFPVPPSASASYVFQFNNRVATLIFLAGAAAFAILFRGLSLQFATKDSRVSRTTALIAITSCVALGILFNWISSPDGLHGEAPYFYSRLSQLAMEKSIYRDFEFAYGPLWLYLPFWIGKLLHLSLIHGYIVFWLVAWAIGIWVLYRLINAIEIPSPYRTVIFILFAADFAQAIWSQGINYAPIRPLLSGGLAMLVYAAHKRGSSQSMVAGIAVVCAAIATAISPEHGIAFMLGTILFFLVSVRQRPFGYWLSMAAMGLGFLAIVAVAQQTGIYTTLHAFSSGGYNYPILPSPGVLCELGLYLVAACVAYRIFQRKQTDSLSIYLLCICFFGMPACFGRCDTGHMQFGAFSALLIAALILSKYPKIFTITMIAFLYLDATPQFRSEYPNIREEVERRTFDPSQRSEVLYRPTVFLLHRLHRDEHIKEIEAKIARQNIVLQDAPKLPDGSVVNAPWSMAKRGFTDDSAKIDYGYFFGMENVILPSQIDFIIQWLQSHPDRKLILPYTSGQNRCRLYNEGDNPSFSSIYGHHWASPKRQMQVVFPLWYYIESHYAPDSTPYSNDMQLWHPIATVPSSGALPTQTAKLSEPLR